jgi:hypothetical protein
VRNTLHVFLPSHGSHTHKHSSLGARSLGSEPGPASGRLPLAVFMGTPTLRPYLLRLRALRGTAQAGVVEQSGCVSSGLNGEFGNPHSLLLHPLPTDVPQAVCPFPTDEFRAPGYWFFSDFLDLSSMTK